jgi:hypothetical protein
LIRLIWTVLTLCLLAGCANVKGNELPMVAKSDPTWALTPDHLDFGALPK